MDYEHLRKEIDRYEELFDRHFNKKQAIGKAQKWHWKGLEEGCKFALEQMRKMIDRSEKLDELIGELDRTKFYKTDGEKEIEQKIKIAALREIKKSFEERKKEYLTYKDPMKSMAMHFYHELLLCVRL